VVKQSGTTTVEPPADIHPTTLLAMYEMMLRIRKFEEKIVEVYPEQEMRCPTHLSIGQEAAAVGVCTALRLDDYVFSTHRCHAHYLAKGGDPYRMIAELYGKKTGCAGGKGGSMHLIDKTVGMMGTSAIVSSSIPVAVGAALAFSMQGSDRVSVAFLGDAGVEQGVFHESLNFAALKRLPMLFACENNLYATYSHITRRQPLDCIYRHGEPYGVPGERVDGNDVLAVYLAASRAVERCRDGKGPALLELITYRWREHVGPNYDWEVPYRTREEVERWMAKCPVAAWEDYLLAARIARRSKLDLISAKIAEEVRSAFTRVENDPFPCGTDLFEDVC